MRVKIFVVFMALLFSTAFVKKSQAAPHYYTFDGSITQAVDYGSGLLGSLAVGDSLSYTFLVDVNAQGALTTYGGATTVLTDSTGWIWTGYDWQLTDYVKTDYVSGSALSNPSSGYHENNCMSCTGEYNYGVQYNHYYYPWAYDYFRLFGEDEDDKIEIFGLGRMQEQLMVGSTGWVLTDRAYSAGYQYAEIKGSLTLTSISDTYTPPASVPEPATLILLGVAMTALILGRRGGQSSLLFFVRC